MAGKEGTEPDTRSMGSKLYSGIKGALGKAYDVMGPSVTAAATDIRQKVVEEGVYGRVTTPQPVTLPQSGIHGKNEGKAEPGGSVWGDKEPTEKQLNFLQGKGVDTEGMTRGEASAAITSLGKGEPAKAPASKGPGRVPVDHDTVHGGKPPTSGWASKEPTDKQLSILEAKGIETEGLTRGEASKAIENLGYDASWYEGKSFRERCQEKVQDHAPEGRSIEGPQPSAPDR